MKTDVAPELFFYYGLERAQKGRGEALFKDYLLTTEHRYRALKELVDISVLITNSYHNDIYLSAFPYFQRRKEKLDQPLFTNKEDYIDYYRYLYTNLQPSYKEWTITSTKRLSNARKQL